MTRLPYSTVAGQVTHGEIDAQMIEYLRLLQECFAVKAHLLNTEDNHMDHILAKGWLGMAELMKRIEHNVIELAKGKLVH